MEDHIQKIPQLVKYVTVLQSGINGGAVIKYISESGVIAARGPHRGQVVSHCGSMGYVIW
jgi:hypothetical protein